MDAQKNHIGLKKSLIILIYGYFYFFCSFQRLSAAYFVKLFTKQQALWNKKLISNIHASICLWIKLFSSGQAKT
jgi:hypothetical protein